MEQDKATFERLIQEDRAARDVREWRGTFLDYLEQVKADPALPRLAHARIHDIVTHAGIGVRLDGTSSGSVITQNWFDSIGGYDYGYAVSLRTNAYADVTDNLMTRVHSGLHTLNFSLAAKLSVCADFPSYTGNL